MSIEKSHKSRILCEEGEPTFKEEIAASTFYRKETPEEAAELPENFAMIEKVNTWKN